jgi:large repetitive protein
MKHIECGLFRKTSDSSQTILNDAGRMARSTFKLMCFFLAALLGFHEDALAQAAYVFPSMPAVQVGSGSVTAMVTVTIQSAGNLTVTGTHVVTQGAASLDFNGSSCAPASYTPEQTCTVSVVFTPKFPGVRSGAIVLIADDGHVMATQYLSGVGTGGLSVLIPGQINTVAGDGCLSVNGSDCPTSGPTPATQFALKSPIGAATDAAGNLYVSDAGDNRVRKITFDKINGDVVQTIANSNGIAGSSGDGGLATSAQINQPSAIAIDGAGNIVFADTGNHAIRRIDAITGKISTVAGTLGSSGFSGDGQAATTAILSSPQGLSYNQNGDLYIADTGNNRIRKIDASSQVITTIAGDGVAAFFGDGVAAISAELNQPWGLAVAIDGSIYIADFKNNYVRKIDGGGKITTVAGNGNSGFTGDQGPARAATLNSPAGVAVDPAGNLYIADSENSVIRKVSGVTPNNIDTIAGNRIASFGGDGFSAALASFDKPYSVYLDGAGNFFVADRQNVRIREVSASIGSLQFPTMKEGKISLPIAQLLENDGNALLNFLDLTAAPLTQNAALDIIPTDQIKTTCLLSTSLKVDDSCILAVEFTPVSVGAPGMGLLSVTSDAGNSPTNVDLSGTVLSVDPSSTTVTSNLNPAGVGFAVTFVAHIASPNQVTGAVQFFNGTIPIDKPQPVDPMTDTATLNTSFSAPQAYTITAAYSGDDLNAASSPNHPLIETVEQATSLNVIPSADPAAEFAPVTFTATLTGWTTPLGGVISFADGSTPLGSSGPLSNTGMASFMMPLLPVGTHYITATFAGDSNNFTSSYSFVQIINLAPTSTILSTSTAVAQFGTPITLTAVVTGVSASIPTGIVNFKDGTVVFASVPVNGAGVATYINSTLTAGTHTITAVYQGDANYATSTSTQIITETISQTLTVTTLSSSATSLLSGRPVVLTASVTAAGGILPTGTIAFMNGNVPLGTVTLSHGVASLSVSDLSVGTDNVTAIYSGDSNDVGSRSQAIAIVVLQTPTSTVVSSSQSPLPTLAPVVISARVTNGGSIPPTGQVTFSEDSVSIGVGTLNASGVATISIPALPAGSHTFTAAYAGDVQDIPSTSAPFVQVVVPRTTSDELTTSATSLTGGQQLTLISVVRPVGTAPATGPTGTVTFLSGTITLATTPIDATGVATVTVILSGSTATISSSYSGDVNYAPSSSSPTQVTIGPAPDFSLEATPTTWQLQTKQHNTITLTLTSVKNFTDTFSLGCLGLPLNATCTFSKDQAELPAGGVLNLTVTVDTNSALLRGTQARVERRSGADTVVLAWLLPGLFGLGLLGLRARRSGFTHSLIALFALSVVALGLAGCGSIQSHGTPPGTYNFIVNATGRTGISQFVSMTMTVTK